MVCVNVGNRERITIAEETTRNTLADFATDGYYIGVEPVMADFNENARGFKDRVSVNGGMQKETSDKGAELHQFSLKYIITDFRFIKAFLSGLTEAGTDPYTHTFDLETSTTSNFFSIQRVIDGGTYVHTYKGCTIHKVKLEFQKATGDDDQGYIRATANVIATSFDKDQAEITVPDSTTKEIFTFNNFRATLGGSVKTNVVSGSIDIDNGINPEEFFYANYDDDSLIGEVCPVFYKTVASLTINAKDDTEVDEWLSDSGVSGTNKLELIRGTDDHLVINLNEVYNLQPFYPTEYKAISKASLVYNTAVSSIVATDSIEEY